MRFIRLKIYILAGFQLLLVLLLMACSTQAENENKSKNSAVNTTVSVNTTVQKDVAEEPKNDTVKASAPQNTDGADTDFQNREAKYLPADNPKYKTIGNARFNFWIDIPVEWKAIDRSADGDGYFIIADNENIDIRTFGGLKAVSDEEYINAVKGDTGKVADFAFRNNAVGKKIEKPDFEINYTCFLPDSHIDFYVNCKNDLKWYEKNKDVLLYIAKSLRSGAVEGKAKEPQDNNMTNKKDYSAMGFELMKTDSVGFMKEGAFDNEVIKNLGEADEKSKAAVWGADGQEHQSWFYHKKGIELDMVKKENSQVIDMIKATKPCEFRTTRNIGVGSTKDEVVTAYKNEIDSKELKDNPSSIVAGTVYGGIIFTLENNKVVRIFIGASAE